MGLLEILEHSDTMLAHVLKVLGVARFNDSGDAVPNKSIISPITAPRTSHLGIHELNHSPSVSPKQEVKESFAEHIGTLYQVFAL